jgi:hypothetical protein
VAVGVVRTDGHQPDDRAGGGEEPGIGVGRAVMRHLEHVGGQVRAVGHDPRLRLGAEVSGQQHPHAPLARPYHEAEVVGLGCRGRPARVGRQHLELRVAHLAPLTRCEDHVLGTGPCKDLLQVRHPVVGRRQRSGGHLLHVPAGQHPGQPTDVVGVQVREQHERQPAHAEPVQAAGDEGVVRAGVHQDRLPGCRREHQRIALPHVAGHHHGVGERPASADLAHRPADGDDPEQGRERERAKARAAHQRPCPGGQQQCEQNGTRRAGRPARGTVGHGGGPLGHHHQPAHRPACEPGEDVGGTGHDG